ncbi:hypothetical protein RRF57_006539 [Xylaria bambusicola]|uniref:Ubiquitin-related modifier 1 n=1 Tax=Xylaria bambusicola TaxID=326684 RepID=A0AAN7USN5_9PEZI
MATAIGTAVADHTSKDADIPTISVIVEFTYASCPLLVCLALSSLIKCAHASSGGLEMLFSDQRRHVLSVPALDKNNKPVAVAYLIEYLCENTMKDTRKELFVLDDHLRPGILVLINDADWELEGEEAYEIQDGDNILFVSTLHGG